MSCSFNTCVFVALLSSTATVVQSFSPQTIMEMKKRIQVVPSTTRLQQSSQSIDIGDDAMGIMFQARDCAFSETCSVEDAKLYLRNVIQVQSDCAVGAFEGEDVCNDADSASEIVSNLRAKIERNVKGKSVSFWATRQKDFEELVLASTDEQGSLSPTHAWRNAPLKLTPLALVALYMIVMVQILSYDQYAAHFTAQEWWWATRDGYLDDVIFYMFKNGGL